MTPWILGYLAVLAVVLLVNHARCKAGDRWDQMIADHYDRPDHERNI